MASPATTASPTYNVQYSPSAQSNCPQTYNVVLGNPNENLGLDYTELPGGRLEISYVPPGTAAGRAGVPRGELVAVGDVPVRSTNELKRAVEDYKARGQLTIPLQVMEKYPLPIVDIPSRLNHFRVEGLQYIRVFEVFKKVSLIGRPSEHALCLGKNLLLLCTVDTAETKRLIKMDEIESVHHFVNANGPQETLIKCFPPEHDVFLKHSMQKPRPSMDELKKLTDALKAVFHHETGQDLHVVESATSLARKAHLSKRQGYTEPKQKLRSISVQKYKRYTEESPVQSPQQHPEGMQNIRVTEGPHRSQVLRITSTDQLEGLKRLVSTLPREGEYLSQWVYLPMECGAALTFLKELGFKLHHAEGNETAVYRWLGPAGEDRVPPFATHHVGVGGVVLNDSNKVLLIQEKTRSLGWKLPGGLSDLGEDIGDAAVREVREETGVLCEFVRVLGVRQSHAHAHGRSDLYFVCLLRPLTSDITPCSVEVSEAAWHPVTTLEQVSSSLNRLIGKLLASDGFGTVEKACLVNPQTNRRSVFYYSKP